MQIEGNLPTDAQALAALFEASFTAAEGPDEGVAIAGLVRDLLDRTPSSDIRVFRAVEAGVAVGAGLFTRLSFPEDVRAVFLLSPMAVAPAHQRRGVGRTLITQALDALRVEGVVIAMTYGDPAYYARVGFCPVAVDRVAPPLPLGRPEGWIGQSLSSAPMPALRGPSHCVAALAKPEFW